MTDSKDTLSFLDRTRLWAYRLKRFRPDELGMVAGVPPRVVQRALEAISADAHGEEENGLWSVHTTDVDVPGRRSRVQDVLARGLDWCEQMVGRVRYGKTPAVRRYALLCLGDMLRIGGGIAQMKELPWPERGYWTDHVIHGAPMRPGLEEFINRRQPWVEAMASRYEARAKEMTEVWIRQGPCFSAQDWIQSVGDGDRNWPDLPSAPTEGERHRSEPAVTARFGMVGQMLAASKSRSPWSPRCVFNAQIRVDDTDVWHGDQWFLPGENPDKGFDPRPGMVDMARFYGKPVQFASEQGRVLFFFQPDGSLHLTDDGKSGLAYRSDMLERRGWPRYGEYASYPIEHRVGRTLP